MTRKVKLRDLTEEQYNERVKNHCKDYNDKCKGCPFSKVKCDNGELNDIWIKNKDLYSDKFLNREIEIEVSSQDICSCEKDEDMFVEPNRKEECIKLQHKEYLLKRIIAGLHYALYKCVPEGDKIND